MLVPDRPGSRDEGTLDEKTASSEENAMVPFECVLLRIAELTDQKSKMGRCCNADG
jgi:hypothetical protein